MDERISQGESTMQSDKRKLITLQRIRARAKLIGDNRESEAIDRLMADIQKVGKSINKKYKRVEDMY